MVDIVDKFCKFTRVKNYVSMLSKEWNGMENRKEGFFSLGFASLLMGVEPRGQILDINRRRIILQK